MTGIVLINTSEKASALPLARSVVLKALKSAWVGLNTKPFQLLALLIDLIRHLLYQDRNLVSFFRGFRFAAFSFSCNDRSWPHNKLLNLAHCVRWTAAPSQIGGFASQNFTTNLQSHIRRLAKRYEISMKYVTTIFLALFSINSMACDENQACQKLQDLGIEIKVTDLNDKSFYKCSMIIISAPEYQREPNLNNFQILMRVKDSTNTQNFLTTFLSTSFDTDTKQHLASICLNPNSVQSISLEMIYTNKDESEKNPISVITYNVQKYVQSHNKAINHAH